MVKHALIGGTPCEPRCETLTTFKTCLCSPHTAFIVYLGMEHNVHMPPGPFWYCRISVPLIFGFFLCSTSVVVSMTFTRFYSIIRPHKAASFNTVKRAKITIVAIIIFCVIYNIPHLYITATDGARCGPFGKAMKTSIGKFYYFFSLFINIGVPFVMLLIMNSIIIREIRRRPKLSESDKPAVYRQGQGQSEGQGETSKNNNSEFQILIILLLVTFVFLVLSTPVYMFFMYINIVDYEATPRIYAGYILFHSVGQKLYQTNFGINFYLYVISGQKFRTDLLKLFTREKTLKNSTSVPTIPSH